MPPRPLPRAALALLAASLVTCAAATAGAQSIDAAREAYERGALTEARARYEAVIAAGSAEPPALAEAHLRLGILRAASGDEAGARAELASALAIDPELTTPEELPPDQAAWVDDARRTPRIELRCELGESGVRVAAEGGPEGLLARVRVAGAAWSTTLEAGGGEVPVPSSEWQDGVLRLRVEALDAAGGVLGRRMVELRREAAAVEADAGATTVALPPVEPAVLALPPAREDDVASSPWLWIGVGAGVVLIGAAIAIGFAVADAQHPGFGAPAVGD